MAQTVKNLPAMQETRVWSLGWEEPQRKGMATQSSIFAWRIPWGRKELGTTEQLSLSVLAELGLNLSFVSWPQKSYLISVYLILIISKLGILIIHYSHLESELSQTKHNTWHHSTFLCDIYILTPTLTHTKILPIIC